MEPCPKCGRANETLTRVCPACGVILSKVRARQSQTTASTAAASNAATPSPTLRIPSPPRASRPAPTPPLPSAPPIQAIREEETTPAGRAWMKVGLAATLTLAALFVIQRMNPAAKAPLPPAAVPSNPVPSELPAPQGSAADSSGLSAEDVAFLNAVFARIQRSPGEAPTRIELERVEGMLGSHPDNAQLKGFLVGLYFRRANQELAQRDFPVVEQTLDKIRLVDDQPEIYAVQAAARGEQQDWPGVEASILSYESKGGRESLIMSVNLAIALQSQGRRAEALAVLARPLFGSCATATSPADRDACRIAEQMRGAAAADANPTPLPNERPRAALSVDASKAEIQSDRFDVRFDGEAQSGVARDVLFVLDRAYVRLKDIYYDQPTRKIPVVLHSSEDYFTKTGAPWWSGGVYSSHNGSIQIPIRGLPRSLPREMEDVLVHELSHAFVDEMSGGWAGHDLQEGLAQYMEGKRIEQELGPAELKRLANTRSQSVMNFYMLSLAITQQMVQSRGQGVINQLLKAMKDAGSEDGGYQKTFGRTGAAMKNEILETFWRRYS